MKRFMSMILMAAVVVTSVVVPNSNNVETVKAEEATPYYSVRDLTFKGQKYDNYEDLVEAIGIEEGGEKVDLDEPKIRYGYINKNGEYISNYTHRQYLKDRNCGDCYDIPDDCVSVLFDGYWATIGYKADGTKVIIYREDGYDRCDYDREGYGRSGYDPYGYNREGYDRDGYYKDGYNKEGYDRYGCGRDGYNDEGYDRYGYDRNGYNKEGYDKEGYDRNGYDDEGYDRNGYNKKGLDRDGCNKFGIKEWKTEQPDPYGTAGMQLFFALEQGSGTLYCFGAQKGEAYFFDKNGWLYKKCSNVEFIVSSKHFGEGKVYYKRNLKTKKPSRYNPKGNKYGDGNKYGCYINKSKSIKKGRYITYRFYKKNQR